MSPRVRAWKQSREIKGAAGLLFQLEALEVMKPDQVSAFIDRVGPKGANLIILDTLGGAWSVEMKTQPRTWAYLSLPSNVSELNWELQSSSSTTPQKTAKPKGAAALYAVQWTPF